MKRIEKSKKNRSLRSLWLHTTRVTPHTRHSRPHYSGGSPLPTRAPTSKHTAALIYYPRGYFTPTTRPRLPSVARSMPVRGQRARIPPRKHTNKNYSHKIKKSKSKSSLASLARVTPTHGRPLSGRVLSSFLRVHTFLMPRKRAPYLCSLAGKVRA